MVSFRPLQLGSLNYFTSKNLNLHHFFLKDYIIFSFQTKYMERIHMKDNHEIPCLNTCSENSSRIQVLKIDNESTLVQYRLHNLS